MQIVLDHCLCQRWRLARRLSHHIRFTNLAYIARADHSHRIGLRGLSLRTSPFSSNSLSSSKSSAHFRASKSNSANNTNMSTTNKKVLVAGLGAPNDEPPQGKGFWTTDERSTVFEGQIEQAKAAGFDIQVYRVNTALSHDIIISDLRAVLKQERWNGVAIGFGIRGTEDFTPIFERMINTVLEEIQPPPKFAFPLRPHIVWEAVSRVYGVPQ